MRVKFGLLKQTQGLHLYAKFHLNVFIVSASGGQKPQFLANFDIFGGSCTDPLLPMRAKFDMLWHTHGIRLPVKFRLDRFILSSCGGEKNPIFAVFCTSAFSDVANWHQSQKVEHGCTTTKTFPYPTASKSFLYFNAFMAKSGAQTLTFKSVTNRQTD